MKKPNERKTPPPSSEPKHMYGSMFIGLIFLGIVLAGIYYLLPKTNRVPTLDGIGRTISR